MLENDHPKRFVMNYNEKMQILSCKKLKMAKF